MGTDCDFTYRETEAFYGSRYHVSAPPAQLTGASCGITYGDVTQCLWNRAGVRMGFFSSRILSEITKGINYSVRPGRGGNNISKSLMEMQNQTLPHTNWDDGWLKKCASHCLQPPPFWQPYPIIPRTSTHPCPSKGQPAKRSLPKLGFAAGDVPPGCHLAGSTLRGTQRNPTGPDTRYTCWLSCTELSCGALQSITVIPPSLIIFLMKMILLISVVF